jgi:hypothetical protein
VLCRLHRTTSHSSLPRAVLTAVPMT